MYKTFNYEFKTGMFHSAQKADEEFEKFLNDMEKDGWVLVTMTELSTGGKNFVFKLVFRK